MTIPSYQTKLNRSLEGVATITVTQEMTIPPPETELKRSLKAVAQLALSQEMTIPSGETELQGDGVSSSATTTRITYIQARVRFCVRGRHLAVESGVKEFKCVQWFSVALRPQRPYRLLGTGSPGRPPRLPHSS